MKLPPLSLTMGLECAKVGIFNYLFDMQSCGGGGGRGNLSSAGRIGDGVSYQYGRDVATDDDDDQRRRMRGHE